MRNVKKDKEFGLEMATLALSMVPGVLLMKGLLVAATTITIFIVGLLVVFRAHWRTKTYLSAAGSFLLLTSLSAASAIGLIGSPTAYFAYLVGFFLVRLPIKRLVASRPAE